MESGIGEGVAVEIEAVGQSANQSDAEPVAIASCTHYPGATAANTDGAGGGGGVGKVINCRGCQGIGTKAAA